MTKSPCARWLTPPSRSAAASSSHAGSAAALPRQSIGTDAPATGAPRPTSASSTERGCGVLVAALSNGREILLSGCRRKCDRGANVVLRQSGKVFQELSRRSALCQARQDGAQSDSRALDDGFPAGDLWVAVDPIPDS